MSSTTIDPRIRARRIEVQRDQGRRRLRRMAWASGALALLIAGVGTTRTPLLDVDHIDVAGAQRTGTDLVAASSGIHLGDRLTGVPLGRVARRIGALPWVGTVQVTRGWPNRVRITVVERQPLVAAALRSSSPTQKAGWVLLDATGRQLAQVAEAPPGLPRLEAAPIALTLAQPAPRRFGPMLTVAASVPPALRARVLVLRPDPSGQVGVTVRLRNGATAAVELGPPDQLERKWLGLASVLDEVDPAGLGRIDLRVPGAPALTRRQAGP